MKTVIGVPQQFYVADVARSGSDGIGIDAVFLTETPQLLKVEQKDIRSLSGQRTGDHGEKKDPDQQWARMRWIRSLCRRS